MLEPKGPARLQALVDDPADCTLDGTTTDRNVLLLEARILHSPVVADEVVAVLADLFGTTSDGKLVDHLGDASCLALVQCVLRTADPPVALLLMPARRNVGDGVEDLDGVEPVDDLDTLVLGQAELPVVMFRNSASSRLNVVYYRGDGNIGWIDPSEDTKEV